MSDYRIKWYSTDGTTSYLLMPPGSTASDAIATFDADGRPGHIEEFVPGIGWVVMEDDDDA